MKIRMILVAMVLVAASDFVLAASMQDDPVLYKIDVEELEWRKASGDEDLSWDIQAWIGRDRDKLWFKTEGESSNTATEEFETQLLYNRSIAPFWDLQLGWRHDWQPLVERDWAALGVAGVAPGFIDTEATLFLGESGRLAARVKVSYELLFTQKLSLQPNLELNWYSDSDYANSLGSGLATTEFGLRLRYAVSREFRPYIGLNWQHLGGATADLARSEGASDSDLKVLAGISWWF